MEHEGVEKQKDAVPPPGERLLFHARKHHATGAKEGGWGWLTGKRERESPATARYLLALQRPDRMSAIAADIYSVVRLTGGWLLPKSIVQ